MRNEVTARLIDKEPRDDFHVGSAAMRMMGQDIAADITGQPAARRWGALAEPDP